MILIPTLKVFFKKKRVVTIKTENSIINEDRSIKNKVIKVRCLKIGMIIAIIAATLYIAVYSLTSVNQSWYNAAYQRLVTDYGNDIIDYDTYDALRDQIRLILYENLLTISIIMTVAMVIASITMVLIIISLLSIVKDESFNRKTRRLALGLAVITFLFALYPLFFKPTTFYFFP